MDILTRINTPVFIDGIFKILENSSLLQGIEGVDSIGRLPQRDLLLAYKHIVHKIAQDIIYKREINDQRLTHDVVLAVMCNKYLGSDKNHTNMYKRFTKDVEAMHTDLLKEDQ